MYSTSRSGKCSKVNPEFPLKKSVCCTAYGTTITASAPTSRGRRYAYYHHQKQGCSLAVNIPKETFEPNFIEHLQTISPSTKYEKLFKAIVLDVWQSNYKKLDSKNARIRKEVEVLENERQ